MVINSLVTIYCQKYGRLRLNCDYFPEISLNGTSMRQMRYRLDLYSQR